MRDASTHQESCLSPCYLLPLACFPSLLNPWTYQLFGSFFVYYSFLQCSILIKQDPRPLGPCSTFVLFPSLSSCLKGASYPFLMMPFNYLLHTPSLAAHNFPHSQPGSWNAGSMVPATCLVFAPKLPFPT